MENIMRYSVRIKTSDIGNGEREVVAQYDQFPTIIGVGDTQEEALAEAKIFLEEYLDYCKEEGIEVPEPELSEWKENFSGKITIRLPKSLHRDLFLYAENDGMSLNSIVNDALRMYLTTKSVLKVTNEAIKSICDYVSEINTSYFELPKNTCKRWDPILLQGDVYYDR